MVTPVLMKNKYLQCKNIVATTVIMCNSKGMRTPLETQSVVVICTDFIVVNFPQC